MKFGKKPDNSEENNTDAREGVSCPDSNVEKPDLAINDKSPFTFSFDIAQESAEDYRKRVSALKDRIDNIAEKVIVKDVPVVRAILSLSSDADDLKKIGKALVRIADIVPEYEETQQKHDLIRASIDNPLWMTAVFADLSSDAEIVASQDFTQ